MALEVQGSELLHVSPDTVQLRGAEFLHAPPVTVQVQGVEFLTAPTTTQARASYDPIPGGGERYLPSWHVARHDRTSLAYEVVHHLAEDALPLRDEQARAYLMRWLPVAPVDEPRYQWTVRFPFAPHDEIEVRVQADREDRKIREATSRHDLDTATDAVYWLDREARKILFRNLQVKQTDLYYEDGYTITGEDAGLVPDANLYWRGQETESWHVLSAESDALSGTTFTLPVTGVITVRYASQRMLTELASGTATITRKDAQTIQMPLVQEELANLFDGWGAVLGIPRLDREDNLKYRKRLLAAAQAPPDPTETGIIRGVALGLGLIGWKTWNGIDTLTLDASGTEQITAVTVVGVERILSLREELSPEPRANTETPVDDYYATYKAWREGATVYLDGVPQSGWTRTDNRIRLAAATSGRVLAEYSVERYTLSRDGSGYVQSVVPGQGLVSGAYTVFYGREVQVHPAGQPDVQEELLLTADGLPTRLFFDLQRRLQVGNPTAFGRAGWGAGYWFEAEEERPGVTYLPLPFDAHDKLR